MASEATDNKRELRCPGCGGAFKEVWAEANYGRVLLLDQCAGCGGVWFDKWELYLAKPSALRSLDKVDIPALLSPGLALRNGSGECPVCQVPLVPFTDPSLPKDATVKRCARCGGVWLNRGDLVKYAEYREARGAEPKTAPGAELPVLKRLQKELNTGNLASPSTLDLASSLDNEPPIDTREVAVDMGFLILQALLRLVFKF